jgi:hypothetical protein
MMTDLARILDGAEVVQYSRDTYLVDSCSRPFWKMLKLNAFIMEDVNTFVSTFHEIRLVFKNDNPSDDH